MEEQKQQIKKGWKVFWIVLVIILVVLVLRIFSLSFFCVFGVIVSASLYLIFNLSCGISKKSCAESRFAIAKRVTFIFFSSYLILTVINFFFLTNNIREWTGVILGRNFMSASDQKDLGIPFPESMKLLYYDEGFPWIEQEAELIAVMDQEDLHEVTELLNKTKDSNKYQMKSKFWYIQYLFNTRKTVYTYSNYIYSKSGGAVTADVLIVFKAHGEAKLYMDIIYW